jgi:hypothetical protein
MTHYPAADGYIIQDLRRKARAARLQANRAAPVLALQLAALAVLYEVDAEARAGGGATGERSEFPSLDGASDSTRALSEAVMETEYECVRRTD